MSMDSDTSSQGGDHRSFRQVTRDRLLFEMLRSTRKHSKSTWKVLIMDKLTTKIISCSCKMADITEEGVSLVEDLYKRRQPLPSLDAIYFIQPTKENIAMFLSDMSGRNPLYKNSPVQKELVTQIKKDPSVLPRIGALSEMNLEYFAIDSQGFTTAHERALEELFSENALDSHKYNACLNTMATRISTVFASMREFPRVHYRVAKTIDASVTTTLRDLVPTKLAAAVWNCLSKYKTSIPDYPQTETCELLIVDRSVDQIAPIIHEWTYDAMCHDLLSMDGNKYVQEVPSKNGSSTERREALLEDHDPIWVELRHAHIADASERLHDKMSNFVSKNKAAQLQQARTGGEISNRDLQKMVQALPQYSDQIEKLSLHVEGVSRENKLRLLMIYAAINPEKFESDKGEKLMQLAGLSADDMIAVSNMRCLCGPETKKSSGGGFTLKFDVHKKKHGLRKERTGEESTWALSRFYPVLEDLIEKISKGELPKDEYYCMNDPSPSFHGLPMSSSVRTSPAHQPAHSMRSRRTGGTWARPRGSDDGYSSDSVLKHSSSDFKKLGQRIFVFVIGGATRSELRAVHKLTSKLKREVILGSSSLDDPPQFITVSSSIVSNLRSKAERHSLSRIATACRIMPF
uniref:SNARE-interacting protein KEULE n=1 Tax=Leersia perrieri TaxID=77586 RepID=A0A0D9VFM7_9ORYZ